MRAHALVVANPACLGRHGLGTDDMVRLCASVDLDAEVWVNLDGVTPSDWETRLAGRPGRLLVAGGDGTVHHVVNALAASFPDPDQRLRIPLGILPLGTANDFARSLGLPDDLSEAMRAIADGATRPVDLGWVNGVRFLNAVHIGSIAETSRQMSPWLKHGLRGGAYALAVASMAWRVKPFRATWACRGERRTVRALHVAIANGRYFGGGMPISDLATLDDGLLDLAVIPALGPDWFGELARGWLSRQTGSRPGVLRLRETTLSIEMLEPPPISLDGEPLQSCTRLEFRVLPRALSIYAGGPSPVSHGGSKGQVHEVCDGARPGVAGREF